MSLKSNVKKFCPKAFLEVYYFLLSYVRRKYLSIKYHSLIKKTHVHYIDVEKAIKERGKQPLRFASYVVYDSTFCAYGIFDLMLAEPESYIPRIVVCPDVARGENQMKDQYKKTKDFFVKKYGAEYVVDGYDESTGVFLDVSEQFDIIYCANPYDAMVNEVHGIKYLSKKNVLPFYISYGCYVDKYGYKQIMPLLEISLFWKIFADDVYSYKAYKHFELYKGKNVILSGYAKMDAFIKYQKSENYKKRIIIAPHHTINNPALPLSNFLELSDFVLELPKLYPQIEFIFRPHPLLFINLINEGYWTENQVNEYIRKIEESGIIYSVGGDYFEIFVNSDAIIHDCASFIYEYLFTNNPCCFVAKKNYKKIISTLGFACLKNYYIAYNKNQIMSFIEEVVINNNDIKANKRNQFTKKNLMLNYPNVSEKILKEIKC